MAKVPDWFYEVIAKQTHIENTQQEMFTRLMLIKASMEWEGLDPEAKSLILQHFEFMKLQCGFIMDLLNTEFSGVKKG